MRNLSVILFLLATFNLMADKDEFSVKLKVRNAFNQKHTDAFVIVYESFLPVDTIKVSNSGVAKLKLALEKDYLLELRQDYYWPMLLTVNTQTSNFEVRKWDAKIELNQYPYKKTQVRNAYQLPVAHYLFNPYDGLLEPYSLYNNYRALDVNKWVNQHYVGFTTLRKDGIYEEWMEEWEKEKAKYQAQLIAKGLNYYGEIDSIFFAESKAKWEAKFIQPEIEKIDTIIRELEMEVVEEDIIQTNLKVQALETMNSMEEHWKEDVLEILESSDTVSTELLDEASKLYKIQTNRVQQSLRNEFEKEKYQQELIYKENITNNLKGKSRLIIEIAETKKEKELKAYQAINPFDL